MIFVFAVAILLLLGFCAVYNIYLGIPITLILAVCLFILLKKGLMQKDQMLACIKDSVRQVLPVVYVLLLIGCVSAAWMACGCTATLVYWGVLAIRPQIFVLLAFLFSCAMSYILGSSFATASTIGIVIMALARAGNVNLLLVGGAIISGIYFGDRGSPISSALLLVGSITQTDHHSNVRAMLKGSIIPLALASLIYLAFSFSNPLSQSQSTLVESIQQTYQIGIWPVLPAILLLTLCFFRLKTIYILSASLLLSLVFALTIQGEAPLVLLRYLLIGYQLPAEHALSTIIQGGGMWSMAKVGYILLSTCSLVTILEQAGLLSKYSERLNKNVTSKAGLYLRNALVALVTAMVGCNQTVSTVMTANLMAPAYKRISSMDDLARDVGSTSLVLAPCIPWNIALFTPAAMLGLTGVSYMPYLFFLYLIPLYNFIYRLWQDRRKKPA